MEACCSQGCEAQTNARLNLAQEKRTPSGQARNMRWVRCCWHPPANCFTAYFFLHKRSTIQNSVKNLVEKAHKPVTQSFIITIKFYHYRTEGVAQAVECLPSKLKTLSSNPPAPKLSLYIDVRAILLCKRRCGHTNVLPQTWVMPCTGMSRWLWCHKATGILQLHCNLMEASLHRPLLVTIMWCMLEHQWGSLYSLHNLFKSVVDFTLRAYPIFVCLVVLGLKLRASHLRGRHSTTWDTLPALFALIILEIGSPFLSMLAWIAILLFYASHCWWDDRCTPSHSTFLVETGAHKFFA
jgi:hypothetical protein